MQNLKDKIKANDFEANRLPDERTLSDEYHVSRSSIKKRLVF